MCTSNLFTSHSIPAEEGMPPRPVFGGCSILTNGAAVRQGAGEDSHDWPCEVECKLCTIQLHRPCVCAARLPHLPWIAPTR